LSKVTLAEFRTTLAKKPPKVGFLTAEVYHRNWPGGGGLGDLARNMMKQAADEDLPLIYVSTAYRYKQLQQFTPDYWQNERHVDIRIDENPNLVKLENKVHVYIQGKDIPLSAYGGIMRGRN